MGMTSQLTGDFAKRKQKRRPTCVQRRLKEFRERQIADDPHCWFCGGEVNLDNSTVDHIAPYSRTGNNSESNLRLACIPCNSKKSHHPLQYIACLAERGAGVVTVWEVEAYGGHQQRRRFSYRRLWGPRRKMLHVHAFAIHRLIRERTCEVVAITRRLDAALLLIGDRDEFNSWLRIEFCWNSGTADNYFRIAETFGHVECLEQFSQKALQVLSLPHTPERGREAAIEAARRGENIGRKEALGFSARFADEPTPFKLRALGEFEETIEWLLIHAENIRNTLTDSELVNYAQQLNRLATTVHC